MSTRQYLLITFTKTKTIETATITTSETITLFA